MYEVKYIYDGVQGSTEINLDEMPKIFDIHYTEDVLDYVAEIITGKSQDFSFQEECQNRSDERNSNRDFTEKAQKFGFTEFKLYKNNKPMPLELSL